MIDIVGAGVIQGHMHYVKEIHNITPVSSKGVDRVHEKLHAHFKATFVYVLKSQNLVPMATVSRMSVYLLFFNKDLV